MKERMRRRSVHVEEKQTEHKPRFFHKEAVIKNCVSEQYWISCYRNQNVSPRDYCRTHTHTHCRFFLGMETYVVAFSPFYARIKRARVERRVAEEKGSFPKRSGVVKVAFDPKGLPISHLLPGGDFVHLVSRVSNTHTHICTHIYAHICICIYIGSDLAIYCR